VPASATATARRAGLARSRARRVARERLQAAASAPSSRSSSWSALAGEVGGDDPRLRRGSPPRSGETFLLGDLGAAGGLHLPRATGPRAQRRPLYGSVTAHPTGEET
jgi:hypothetical protein